MFDERGLVRIGLLELSEFEMVGDEFFLESVVLESETFGLSFEELVGPEAAPRTEFSLVLKVF